MTKAIILIHGFLTGPDDWKFFAPEIEDEYDEVRLFCQPGHCTADKKPNYKEFSHKACYANLKLELDDIFSRHSTVDVIGHSMGGAMAIWAAAHYPVHRLVLISTSLSFPRWGIGARLLLYRSRRRRIKQVAALIDKSTDDNYEGTRYHKDFEGGVKLLFSRLLPYWTPRNIGVLRLNSRKGLHNINRIICPTLILWGDLDEFVPKSSVKKLERKLLSRDVTVVLYGDIGHSMMLSSSRSIVNRDIIAFLHGTPLTSVLPFSPSELRTVTHSVSYEEDGEIITKVDKLAISAKCIGKEAEIVTVRTTRKIIKK